MIDYEVLNGIASLVMNNPKGSVNVINQPFIESLNANLDKALADDAVKGIILTSSKKDFMVGGDLNHLMAAKNAQEVVEIANQLDAALRKMETGGKPVVAAINGTALGGGYELCLACHYRILVNGKSVRVGLPEVTLGLLPGGGGTQRLPRLIGIQPALQPLLEGKRLRPEQAHQLGMVDELTDTAEELLSQSIKWIEEGGEAVQPWDQKKFKIPGGGVKTPNSAMVFGATAGLLLKKTYGNYPAPHCIMNCVFEGLQLPIERGLALESRYFAQCVTSPEAKNMIRTLFFSLNKANKGGARPKDIPVNDIQTVGVLGAGMMGAGIAFVSANAGINVILKDVSVEAAEKGKAYSADMLAKWVGQGRIAQDKSDEVLGRIEATDKADRLSECQLVIEAVFEDRTLKATVTKESEAVMAKGAVFASNTSTLPITGLAEASKAPENFIGLHFFSPVDKMPLVEIILGEKSSDYATAMCVDYIGKIKKTPIVVNDGRGFFTSRVFKTYLLEGIECLAEGVSPVLIDNAGKMAGMPVGPLAIADEVSIELMYKINIQTEQDLGEKYKGQAMKVVNKFITELDRPGKKAGKGFYEYPKGKKKFLWPELAKLYPQAENQPDVEEVKQRLLYIQAIESARTFEENIVTSAQDADIGSILGIGFPPYTGGALSFIDWKGVTSFVETCKELENKCGERFSPPKILLDMAEKGEGFYTDA
ncbi:MAG TPA: 3-hydroxyacyl-CoA dehydrogenase [Flavobacteriales bacterium]|nr:3-hydroxyacyl-CoA dehydrogenase [Flavobacteriales bacterium]